MVGELLVAYRVVLGRCVLSPIDLDDHASLSTNKIDDVGTNRFLSDELVPSENTGAEAVPESCLRIGGGAMKAASALRLFQVRAAHCCTSPSPAALRAIADAFASAFLVPKNGGQRPPTLSP
jgi:hypothetical protein